jgi:hypothetical protein
MKHQALPELFEYIDPSVLKDTLFAKEVFLQKVDPWITLDEIERKEFGSYRGIIEEVPEVKVFLNNYLNAATKDNKSLAIATPSLTGRNRTNGLVRRFLGEHKTRKK